MIASRDTLARCLYFAPGVSVRRVPSRRVLSHYCFLGRFSMLGSEAFRTVAFTCPVLLPPSFSAIALQNPPELDIFAYLILIVAICFRR